MDVSNWRDPDQQPVGHARADPLEKWAKLESKSCSTEEELRARFAPPTCCIWWGIVGLLLLTGGVVAAAMWLVG